jgi:chemotaxis signal transduction protein
VTGRDPRLVAFRIGDHRAALPLASVREVIAAPSVVPVPGALRHVAGVALSRGVAIPVYDLRRFEPLWSAGAAGRPAEATEGASLIVCGWGETLLGLLGEAVDLLETAGRAGEGETVLSADYVSGLLQGGDGIVALLDPSRLFASLGVPEDGAGGGHQGGIP